MFSSKTHHASTGGRGHGRPRRDPKDGAKSIEAAVRDAIRQRLPDDPTILAIAEALSINTRTLQRRLAKDGWSYRRLLDDCRRRLAEDELSRQELSIAHISRRLGYSDPSHFVRAFRRWTGETPSRFHARMKP